MKARSEHMRIASGARAAFPESDYEVGVENVTHRIAKAEGDEFARSMVTATVLVFEKGEQVHRELIVDGEAAWFRDLELKLEGATGEEASLLVTRSPFTSILPRPS